MLAVFPTTWADKGLVGQSKDHSGPALEYSQKSVDSYRCRRKKLGFQEIEWVMRMSQIFPSQPDHLRVLAAVQGVPRCARQLKAALDSAFALQELVIHGPRPAGAARTMTRARRRRRRSSGHVEVRRYQGTEALRKVSTIMSAKAAPRCEGALKWTRPSVRASMASWAKGGRRRSRQTRSAARCGTAATHDRSKGKDWL